MSIDKSYNFRRASDLITTSGAVEASDIEGLASEGYEAVINLLPTESEDALAGESSVVEKQGIQYFHMPVDFQCPKESDYAEFTEILDSLLDRKVHIHCAANYRVSVFYALYALQSGSWSQKQADEFIANVWDPSEYPGWPEFIERVKQSNAEPKL